MNKTNLLVRVDVYLLSIIFSSIIALNTQQPFFSMFFMLFAAASCMCVFDIELKPWWLPSVSGILAAAPIAIMMFVGSASVSIPIVLWVASAATFLVYMCLKKKLGMYEIYTLASLGFLSLLVKGELLSMVFRIFVTIGIVFLVVQCIQYLSKKPPKSTPSTSEEQDSPEETQEDIEQVLKTVGEIKQKEIFDLIKKIEQKIHDVTDIKRDSLLEKNLLEIIKILKSATECQPFLNMDTVTFTLEQMLVRVLSTTHEVLQKLIVTRNILGDDDDSRQQSLELLETINKHLSKELASLKSSMKSKTTAHISALKKLTKSQFGEDAE